MARIFDSIEHDLLVPQYCATDTIKRASGVPDLMARCSTSTAWLDDERGSIQ